MHGIGIGIGIGTEIGMCPSPTKRQFPTSHDLRVSVSNVERIYIRIQTI